METITINKIEPISNKDGEIFAYKVNGSYRVRPKEKESWGLKAGMTGLATIETKTREVGDKTYTDKFITSWAEGPVQAAPTNGHTNGSGYVPDPAKDRSIVAQVILKEAVGIAVHEAQGEPVDPNRVREAAIDLANVYNELLAVVGKPHRGG